jgi:ketosteroid isomerase-like protein
MATMYMPSPYETVLRTLVVAAADDRLAEVAPKLFADEAVLHVPGSSALSGDYTGPAAIAEGFFKKQATLAGSLQIKPVQMDVRGTRGVLVMELRAERGGAVFEDRQVGVFKLGTGKIQEGWIESNDQDAFDEFFAG